MANSPPHQPPVKRLPRPAPALTALPPAAPSHRRATALASGIAVAGVLTALLATMLAASGGLGGDAARAIGLWFVLLTSIWLPLLWVGAAWGYGAWAVSGLRRIADGGADDGDAPGATEPHPAPWSSNRPRPEAAAGLGATAPIGIGVALLLWLDHALGAAGWLQAGGGLIAWSVLIIGVVAAGLRLVRIRGRRHDRGPDGLGPQAADVTFGAGRLGRFLRAARPLGGLLFVLPAAVMLVAAASAPGWLWDTEAAGYDALSYHLQLPREWLEDGRLQGYAHNVYSFLPSYMEAAYYHLAVLQNSIDPISEAGHPAVRVAYACQLLHVIMAALAGVMTWDFVRSLGHTARRRRTTDRTRSADTPAAKATAGPETHFDRAGTSAFPLGALISAVVTVGLPWMVVVGSLAYNEAAVVLLLVASLAVAVRLGEAPASGATRSTAVGGAVIGGLLGVALGAKLTAVGFAVIPVGLVAVGRIGFRRPGRLLTFVLLGSLGGMFAIAPWAVRNAVDTARLAGVSESAEAVATANPLFPFATGIFGTAHWTTEQAMRWKEAHGPDPDAGAVPWRRSIDTAVLHPQWAGLWVAAGLAALGVLAMAGLRRREKTESGRLPAIRRTALDMMLVVVAQVLFWAFFTHQHSRFLIPAVAPLSVLLGLVIAVAAAEVVGIGPKEGRFLALRRRMMPAVVLLGVGFAAWIGLATLVIFTQQRKGDPATFVDALDFRTGAIVRQAVTEDERRAMFAQIPEALVNFGLPSPDRASASASTLVSASASAFASGRDDRRPDLLLIGGATPYYILRPLRWHTTWDRSPLGDLIEAHPDDPSAWARGLRDDLGVRYLLVDFSELDRLIEKDGWYDPRVKVEDVQRLIETRSAGGSAAAPSIRRLQTWPPPPAAPVRGLYEIR